MYYYKYTDSHVVLDYLWEPEVFGTVVFHLD
ncbi:hypothetical protein NMY3_00135 [Candidatus Nitrosocosmicus oleophilus]|jgi:hypothetical protein|uniref:Uncharacterized protein n=1 Tax=Candidatus Nitrosocosmicus oleophilus TaxID=1353260 RepID=A0A654LVE4_9ARCH|nr:hypothetical protein NMY3_00135 [Candidatus Nitrosocosmicus oleophilus]